MVKQEIPLCFYPTKVVLVDDDSIFLSVLTNLLHSYGIPTLPFNSSQKALSYLNNLPNKNKFVDAINDCSADEGHGNTSYHSIDMNVFKNLSLQKERADEASVLVVDYRMPDMTGDELIEKVENRYIKKLMLTTRLDYKIAIQLLNDKLIDNFTEKTPHMDGSSFIEKIFQLQSRYFEGLTQVIADTISKQDSLMQCCAYQTIVKKILTEYEIVEHALISSKGSRVFFDKSGRRIQLTVADEGDMEGWTETAILAEAPDSITSALKKRTKILCLCEEGDTQTEPAKWSKLLLPASKAVNNQATFYYHISYE